MMQHCQQVFAEVTQGGMSIGAGGMPRTMIAGQPPQMPQHGMHPGQQMQPQQQNPNVYQQASPQMKTMVAQLSPFANQQGQAQPQQSGLAASGPGPYQQASPMQKTIVAGMAPPIIGGQMMPQHPAGSQPGQPGMMPGASTLPGQGGPGGPNKTVMLQPSEGIVSMARTGHAVQPATGGPGAMVSQGASTLFWIVSLVIGIAVGALAYVVVLQL